MSSITAIFGQTSVKSSADDSTLIILHCRTPHGGTDPLAERPLIVTQRGMYKDFTAWSPLGIRIPRKPGRFALAFQAFTSLRKSREIEVWVASADSEVRCLPNGPLSRPDTATVGSRRDIVDRRITSGSGNRCPDREDHQKTKNEKRDSHPTPQIDRRGNRIRPTNGHESNGMPSPTILLCSLYSPWNFNECNELRMLHSNGGGEVPVDFGGTAADLRGNRPRQ